LETASLARIELTSLHAELASSLLLLQRAMREQPRQLFDAPGTPSRRSGAHAQHEVGRACVVCEAGQQCTHPHAK
jgi:hypothetical protein